MEVVKRCGSRKGKPLKVAARPPPSLPPWQRIFVAEMTFSESRTKLSGRTHHEAGFRQMDGKHFIYSTTCSPQKTQVSLEIGVLSASRRFWKLAHSQALPSQPSTVQLLAGQCLPLNQSIIVWQCLKPSVGFPGGSVGKEPGCNMGYLGSISGLGRSPRVGNGCPLQYFCLENSMDIGSWQATVHGVPRSWTQLSWT